MIPSGLLLVALAVLITLAPAACRRMTPQQLQRWQTGLSVGCAVLLLLVVAAGVQGLRHTPL